MPFLYSTDSKLDQAKIYSSDHLLRGTRIVHFSLYFRAKARPISRCLTDSQWQLDFVAQTLNSRAKCWLFENRPLQIETSVCLYELIHWSSTSRHCLMALRPPHSMRKFQFYCCHQTVHILLKASKTNTTKSGLKLTLRMD